MNLQSDIAAWIVRSWPDEDTPDKRMTSITEEIGELARCIAKRRHGTRGTPEEWTVKLREEFGDVMISLLGLAEVEGFDAFEATRVRWAVVRARDRNHDPL